MNVQVERMWCDGKLIPRWRLGALKPVQGELRIEECRDEYLRRNLRMARLLNITDQASGNGDALPPLYDVAVLYVRGDRMSITGFERDEGLGQPVVYAQTWVVQVLTSQKRI
jgi:hypothetical protein